MGDDLQISGGAGGVTAHYDDMLSYAKVLDKAGDGLRSTSSNLGGLVVDGDLAQALILCPTEVAEVEAAIIAAATGPDGALWTSGELEVSARYLRTSVDAYKFVDEQLANLEELGWTAAGWALGAALPGLALLGGTAWLVAQSDPRLKALLDDLLEAAPGEIQETLYDNPWLQEALTRMAPGVVQGTAFSLAGLLGPQAIAALMAASGGNWPSSGYQSSIAGLIALAGLGGAFQDIGGFTVTPEGEGREMDINAGNIVSSIFREQGLLGDPNHAGEVQVIEVPGHPPSYIVQIPGTQEWSPKRGDNPVDLTSNVNLMAMQGQTVIEEQVAAAMKAAGIGPDDPVMLTGHSQGGITAAAIASDPSLDYNVTSVVTGGAPIGRFDIPDDVSVLSLEHDQDIVPKLDGSDNPDRSNWVTVNRELSDAEGTQNGQRGPGGAHTTRNYTTTGADIDDSTSKTLEAWREQNREFFSDEPSTASRYQITPDKEG